MPGFSFLQETGLDPLVFLEMKSIKNILQKLTKKAHENLMKMPGVRAPKLAIPYPL